MDGLEWKTLLKWMIWGYFYFWKHPCGELAWPFFLKRNFLSSTSEVIFFGRLDNFFTHCETFSQKRTPKVFFRAGKGEQVGVGWCWAFDAWMFYFPQVRPTCWTSFQIVPMIFCFFSSCLSGFFSAVSNLKFTPLKTNMTIIIVGKSRLSIGNTSS